MNVIFRYSHESINRFIYQSINQSIYPSNNLIYLSISISISICFSLRVHQGRGPRPDRPDHPQPPQGPQRPLRRPPRRPHPRRQSVRSGRQYRSYRDHWLREGFRCWCGHQGDGWSYLCGVLHKEHVQELGWYRRYQQACKREYSINIYVLYIDR